MWMPFLCVVVWMGNAGSMLAVSGLSPMISALSVNPSRPTSPIYLLPRFSEEGSSHLDKWRVPIEVPSQLWLLHVANSFEQKDDKGNLDIQIYAAACSYQWFNFQKMFGNSCFFFLSFLLLQFLYFYFIMSFNTAIHVATHKIIGTFW